MTTPNSYRLNPLDTALSQDPYLVADATAAWNKRGIWPAHWITTNEALGVRRLALGTDLEGLANAPTPQRLPSVVAYRLRFSLDVADTVRLHVTGDERYELYLDGVRVGRGSERGDADHWYFESYDLPLGVGEHLLVARVWALELRAPFAQMTVGASDGGCCPFLCSPQEEKYCSLLATGVAPWEAKGLLGYRLLDHSAAWGTGDNLLIDGKRFDWGFERGEGEGWYPVIKGEAGSTRRRNDRPLTPVLEPAALPAMHNALWTKGRVRIVTGLPHASLQDIVPVTVDQEEVVVGVDRKSVRFTCDIPLLAEENLVEECEGWQRLLGGVPLTVPPHTLRRVLIDLEDYLCAYPEIVVSGGEGSLVRIHWQESLFEEVATKSKGNRDEVEGKYFTTIWHRCDGIGDAFLPDGGEDRQFRTLWWQCGRYVEIVVRTEEAPLTLKGLRFHETRYPLEPEGRFEASDARLTAVAPLMLRALQMCSHETYMDCPFYEQLMYIGDTRLEVLTTYALTRDTRLPRKALQLFDYSRQLDGLTQSRYPTRVFQSIPPFSLWWVAMIHDHARWRDDLPFIRNLMPGARGVVEYFVRLIGQDGLLHAPDGWNCFDWVATWRDGTPPCGHVVVPGSGVSDVSGPITWQLILVLRLLAELEVLVGENELAARCRRLGGQLASRAGEVFWSEERGLFADDVERKYFSEHSQCLALLGGMLDPAHRDRVATELVRDSDPDSGSDLARTTIYFSHYLFETYHLLGRTDLMLKRMQLWFDLAARGLKTTVEMPEPTRSDCHAWGAHPLYHYRASILGIRPASMGFRTVRIVPDLGPLTSASGIFPHPKGDIVVDLQRAGGRLSGHVVLPVGLRGAFEANGMLQPLRSGQNEIGQNKEE